MAAPKPFHRESTSGGAPHPRIHADSGDVARIRTIQGTNITKSAPKKKAKSKSKSKKSSSNELEQKPDVGYRRKPLPPPPPEDASDEIKLKYRISTLFTQFDKDGNGVLTKEEVVQLMKRLKGGISRADIDKVFKDMDRDFDEEVDIEEFVEWVVMPPSAVKVDLEGPTEYFDLSFALRPLWAVYDKDGSGSISFEEFEDLYEILQGAIAAEGEESGNPSKRIAPELGLLASAKAAFQQADDDGDKCLDFDEFVDWQREAIENSKISKENLVELVAKLADLMRSLLMVHQVGIRERRRRRQMDPGMTFRDFAVWLFEKPFSQELVKNYAEEKKKALLDLPEALEPDEDGVILQPRGEHELIKNLSIRESIPELLVGAAYVLFQEFAECPAELGFGARVSKFGARTSNAMRATETFDPRKVIQEWRLSFDTFRKMICKLPGMSDPKDLPTDSYPERFQREVLAREHDSQRGDIHEDITEELGEQIRDICADLYEDLKAEEDATLFKDRTWQEFPKNMTKQGLVVAHMRHQPMKTKGVDTVELQVSPCIPAQAEKARSRLGARYPRWLGQVERKVKHKESKRRSAGGRRHGVQGHMECKLFHYCYEEDKNGHLRWLPMDDLFEYEFAYTALDREKRILAALLTQSNFAMDLSWEEVIASLKYPVELGLIHEEDFAVFSGRDASGHGSCENMMAFCRAKVAASYDGFEDLSEKRQQQLVEKEISLGRYQPLEVMGILSEAGIVKDDPLWKRWELTPEGKKEE